MVVSVVRSHVVGSGERIDRMIPEERRGRRVRAGGFGFGFFVLRIF